MGKTKFRFKLASIVLSSALLIGLLPNGVRLLAASTSGSGAVESESATFDVFMNVDPSYGVEADDLATKVGGYLQKQIDADLDPAAKDKNYRINTTSVKVDPTDLTKWEVYDHYDTAWYTNESDWKTNYNGRNVASGQDLPENWYYSAMTDSTANANKNGKTTIDKITSWGNVAQLREHIFTKVVDNKPAMQFYGYGEKAFADFLYYPATTTSTKSLAFDVDASNVKTHSMKYSGFLINAGTTGTGSNKKMNGYLVVFAYSGGSGVADVATGLSGVYLYNLSNNSVDTLHTSGITGSGTSAQTSPFYKKSHIEMEIESDHLTATIQKLKDDGSVDTASAKQTLFNTNLTDTGYGGFGPYVQYSSHNCGTTSSFEFSNLEMSFKEKVGASSPLESYKYADYLKDSDNRFYINLTQKDTTNYDSIDRETDIDKGYLKQIQDKKAVMITDEGTQSKNTIFPEKYLKTNTKNTFDEKDVSNHNIASLYTGSDEIETLAAKLAWLIYHTQWDDRSGGETAQPEDTLVGDIKLMDGNDFINAQQVNYIYRQYISNTDKLKVYPNITESTNYDTATDNAKYTLTFPDKKTQKDITLTNGYFIIDNSSAWPVGDYVMDVSFTSTNLNKQCIGASTSFTINSDTVAPKIIDPIFQKAKATLNFENTASTGSNTFTSPLEAYGYIVSDSATKPSSDPTYLDFASQTDFTISNIELGNNLTTGTKYLHIYVKDKAGNSSYVAKAFTVTAPSIAFKENLSGNSASNPYKGDSLELNPTANTYDIDKVQVSTNGTTWVDVAKNADGNYVYELPYGTYTLQTKAIDTAGNTSVIQKAYVDAKKVQKLVGTKEYNLELGIDTDKNGTFDMAAFDSLTNTPLSSTIKYEIVSNLNTTIALSKGSYEVTNLGQATVKVTAEADSIYRETADAIVVNVKNPLSVKLNVGANAGNTGLVVNPTYVEGYHGMDSAILKYHVKGDANWTTASWTMGNSFTLLYADLKDYTEYEFKIEASDDRAYTASDVYSFRTPDLLPQINTSDVKDGIRGEEYNDKIDADGTNPITYEIIEGNLPDGLILDKNTGEITGTPTKPGNYEFTVEVTNGAGNKTDKKFDIFIANPPTITTTTLPETVLGDAYDQFLTAEGDAQIKWIITDGKLPNGLTLDETSGRISGTTTEYGNFEFTVTATNTAGTDSKKFGLYVAQPPKIETQSLPNTFVGDTYSKIIKAVGDKTLQWALANGSKLPDGLSLNKDTGEVSGTPTKPGTYTFDVTVTNSVGNDTIKYTIYVADPPVINTTTLDKTILGHIYEQTLIATGDNPMEWSLSKGKLPAGLTLDKNSGKISGTPTEFGTFKFTVTVVNAVGTDMKELSIFVAQPPVITTIELPNTFVGDTYEQSITADGDKPLVWSLTTKQRSAVMNALPDGLVLDPATGALTGTPTKPGTFKFNVMVKNDVGYDIHAYEIYVADPPKITTDKVSNAIKGKPFIDEFEATGDKAITWELTEGNLPKGLTLHKDTGKLEGTPIENGTFNFKIEATNAVGTDTREYKLFVANPPTIHEDQEIPEFLPGKDVDFTIGADGDGPFHYEVVEGKLPDGVTLDPDTGKISGKPTQPGDYTFVIEVDNGVGKDRKEITISIPFPPTLITQPVDKKVEENNKVTFQVDVVGTDPFTFQWQINRGNGWVNIDGATEKEYSFLAQLKDNGARFRCLITNKADTVTSNAATLTVTKTPDPATTPKTGDSSNMILWYSVMAIALITVIVACKRRSDEKKK